MNTKIRKATKKDITELAKLRREFHIYFQKELKLYGDSYIPEIEEYENHIEDFLKRRLSKIFVALVDSKVVGYIKGHIFEDDFDFRKYGNIDEIIINKDYRGQGISKLLGNELEKYLRKHNIEGIYSSVHNNNESSLKLHENQGFKPISTDITLYKK